MRRKPESARSSQNACILESRRGCVGQTLLAFADWVGALRIPWKEPAASKDSRF
ncbi:MAG: hypothetical protein AB8B63_23065 [Granulosicoccus sp.]